MIALKSRRQGPRKPLPNINERIRFDKMQVISHDGRNLGIMTRNEALDEAKRANLDLVLLAEQGSDGVPVTKIMDYGKAQYAKKKQAAEAKKHQKTIQVKEVKFRPKIGGHDFETKIKRAIEFINAGKHVKMTLQFRGREIGMKDTLGNELFDKIQQALEAAELPKLFAEKDSKSTTMWSRVYYIKK